MGRRQAPGWTNNQLAMILATRAHTVARWRTGERYPDVRALLRIELLLGWPAAEQIVLIPPVGNDLRYAMVLNEVLKEWMIANPRAVPATELRSGTPRTGPRRVV